MFKKVYILYVLNIVFSICILTVNAQTQKKTDKKAVEFIDDSLKIKKYNELIDNYMKKNPDSALYYAKELQNHSEKTSNKYEYINALLKIGVIYENLGISDISTRNFMTALNLAKEYGYESLEATAYNNFGVLYMRTNNNLTAIEYFLKSLQIHRKLNDKKNVIKVLHNTGLSYYYMDSLEISRKYFDESIKLAKEYADIEILFHSLYMQAPLELGKKNFNKALEYIWECLSISRTLNNTENLALSYNGAALIFKEMGDLNLAISYFDSSITYASTINLNYTLEKSYLQLSNIYKAQNKYEKAYKYLQLYNEIVNASNKKQLELTLKELENELLIAQKNKEISYLEDATQLLKKIVKSEKLNKYYLLLVFILSIVIAVSNLHRILPNAKSIAIFVIMAIIIMTAISFLLKYLFFFNEGSLFSIFVDVLTVATLPLFFIVLMTEKYFLNKNIKIARDLNRQLKEYKSINEENIITIEFNNDKKTLKLKLKELICIEANENYVTVHFYKCDAVVKELFRGTLKSVYEHLSDFDEIIRCHKSYVVNITYIKNITGNSKGYKLHIDELDFDIPVSRGFPQEILNNIKEKTI